jgi:hypothetical protein
MNIVNEFCSGPDKAQPNLRIILSEIRKDLESYHSQKFFTGKTRQTLRQHKQAIKEKLLSKRRFQIFIENLLPAAYEKDVFVSILI